MTLADQFSNLRKSLPGGSPRSEKTTPDGTGVPGKPREKRSKISVWQYLKEIFEELKKVSWPKRKAVYRGTVQVIVFSAVLAAILGGFDLAFQEGLDRILKKTAPAVEATPIDATGIPLDATGGAGSEVPLELPEGVPPPPGFEGSVQTIPSETTPPTETP